jgi:hypothetical protein
MNFRGSDRVYSDVRSTTTDGDEKLRRLREAYRDAFGDWALQVRRLQAGTASPAGTFILKEAEDRVAAAEIAYRDTRDRLTDDMVDPSEPSTFD